MYAFNDQPHCLQILLLELEKVPWKLPRSLWSKKKKQLGKAVKVLMDKFIFVFILYVLV